MSQSEASSSILSLVSNNDLDDSLQPLSETAPPSSRLRNRTGILSRGHSNRCANHLVAPESNSLYPSASEDDDGGQGDVMSDSGPMPRRFPPQSAASARSSSSLQSQYRSTSITSPAYPLPCVSPLSSAASSSSCLVVDVPCCSDRAPPSWPNTASYPHSADDTGFDLVRAKSISSVSSLTSTSSMEAAPFRAAPLGKIRMAYTAPTNSSAPGRQQATALRIPAKDLSDAAWPLGLSGSLANSRTPTSDGDGMAAFMEAAQETATKVAGQDVYSNEAFSPSPIELRMGGSAELPRRPADPEIRLVSSPAAALAARQKGFLPKPASNEWLYRNGPGLGSNMGGKPIPGAYRSLAEMKQGTAEVASSVAPAPCPSPTSKRTAAVIRSKLAKSASKLGLKPLTVVPGATASHPRVAIEFADSASTTSEKLDVQQDLISSATGAALADARAMNVRPQPVALTSTLLNASGGASADFVIRTSSATNAPLIVPRLSPRPDSVSRMSGAVGTPSSSKESKALAKAAVSPCASPIVRPTEDDQMPLTLGLTSSFTRPDSRGNFPRPFVNIRQSSSLLAILGSDTDAAPLDPSSGHHDSIASQPTPAEVVRMEAKAGIARLPTVGSGSTPGPTPTIRSASPFSNSTATTAEAHQSALKIYTLASLPPSTALPSVQSALSTTTTADASPIVPNSPTRPGHFRSSSSHSQTSLPSLKSHSSSARPRANGHHTSTKGEHHYSPQLTQQLEKGGNLSGTTLTKENQTYGRNDSAGRSAVENDPHNRIPVDLRDQWQGVREALDLPHPRSEDILSADEDNGFELGAEVLGTANSPRPEASLEPGHLLEPSPTRPTRPQLFGASSNKDTIERLCCSTQGSGESSSAAGTAPPILRMESTNTAVSKAVSDTSDMDPPVPFKRPAKVAAGRMDPSDLRYDVMEAPAADRTRENGGHLNGDSVEHGKLAVPTTSAGAAGDRLSVITEASPDGRSNRPSVGMQDDTLLQTPSDEGKVSGETKQTDVAPCQAVTATGPSAKPRGRDDFEFGDILGEGSFSTVILAWDLLTHGASTSSRVRPVTSVASALSGSGSKADASFREGKRAYAIKVLDKVHILKERKQKYVAVEKEALTLLVRQPGIIRLYWTFQDQESLYFVLELAPNGELLTFIKRYGSFDEQTTRYYAAQILDAIAGMHVLGVIHRDVKPENVLLDDKMRVKLTDFGSAKIIRQSVSKDSDTAAPEVSRANSFVGTAEYVSPELLTDKAASEASDFWAFGCIVFQMLVGRPPFKAISEYQTFQKIIKREFEMPSELSSDAKDLLDNLLALEPEQRLKADQIRSHSFFSGVDWSDVWNSDAPAMKTGIRAPPPPREAREQNSDSMFDVFGGEDWLDDEDLALAGEPTGNVWAAQQPSSSIRPMPTADSSDEDAVDDGQSQTASADLVSLQSGHRADIEGDESPGSSHSYLPFREATAEEASALSVPSAQASEPATPALDRLPPARLISAPPPQHQPMAILNWAALLLPHEALLYASPAIHRRTGAANLQSKKRMLILTDFPRLLCVKEDTQCLKVKSEVLLAIPGDGGGGSSRQLGMSKSQTALSTSSTSSVSAPPTTRRGSVSGLPSALYVINIPSSSAALQSNPNVLLSIEQRGIKTIVIHTPARSYTYDDPSGDASNWVRSLLSAAGKR